MSGLGWLGLVVILVAFGALAFGCRANQIDDCRNAGGRPITHAWWSERYFDPGCLRP